MGISFLGGLAAAADGYRTAMESNRREDRQAVLDGYAKADHEYQAGQRERTLKQQGVSDKAEEAMRNVRTEDEVTTYGEAPPENQSMVPAIPGDRPDAGPLLGKPAAPTGAMSTPSALPTVTKRMRSRQEMALDQAKALMGGTAEQMERGQKMWDHASSEIRTLSNYKINSIEDGMAGKDLMSTAREVESVFNKDAFPGTIKDLVENPDKSVSFTAYNQETGTSRKMTFRNQAELIGSVRAHYSPEAAAELRAARAAAAAKTRKLAPGEIEFGADGRIVAQNDNDSAALSVAKYKLLNGGQDGSGGSGGSKGSGKAGKPVGEFDAGDEALETALKTSEHSLTTGDVVAVRALMHRITTDNRTPARAGETAGGGINPARAVEIAIALRTKPELEVPDVDLATGKISMVVRDAAGGDIFTRKDFADAGRPMGLTGAQLRTLATQMRGAINNPEELLALQDIAFEPSGKAARIRLDQQSKKLRADIAANPAFAKANPQDVEAFIKVQAENLIRKAHLLKNDPDFGKGEDRKPLRFDANGARIQLKKNTLGENAIADPVSMGMTSDPMGSQR